MPAIIEMKCSLNWKHSDILEQMGRIEMNLTEVYAHTKYAPLYVEYIMSEMRKWCDGE